MYDYHKQRAFVFTEEGQIMFLKIRDRAKELLEVAGAIRSGKLYGVITGDTWDMTACIDRLIEIGDLREIAQDRDVAGQDRILVKGRNG